MAQKASKNPSTEPFEYVLFDDPENLKSSSPTDDQINTWINPDVLKLSHRIGRGPFGDVWIATHHLSTEDYDEYHEVAVKLLLPVKDDQVQPLITRFNELYYKCQGLQHVCTLHGITIKNEKVGIVMKFYEGSLGDKMACAKSGTLQLSDVINYGANLSKAVMELHSRGILSLNIKPCNLLLDERSQVFLGEFGIPYLLYGFSSPNPDMVQRLGTPNYMAPEQWQPDVRGPISYETDSWGFGCSIIEMLTGVQPWRGMSPDEIYQATVTKQVKPDIPSGLPYPIEVILHKCFEYDLRNRPLMRDILHAFNSCKIGLSDADIIDHVSYTDWYPMKDRLQVGDIVRSRKAKNSSKVENMEIPEGQIVGLDTRNGYVLVRVHGVYDPLRVPSSALERVTHGFAAGDWVQIKGEDKKHSPIGILHSIDRDGRVSAGFIGRDTLWRGDYTELHMAGSFFVGQFVRLKANITNLKFEWPYKTGEEWVAGRISQVLPNGCLVIRFPGRLVFGDAPEFLAHPAEVEVVSFSTCEGMVKKYQHLEELHWAVRPFVIALGLFTALKMGLFIGKGVGRLRKKGRRPDSVKQDDVHSSATAAWLPPNVANILFRDGSSSNR